MTTFAKLKNYGQAKERRLERPEALGTGFMALPLQILQIGLV